MLTVERKEVGRITPGRTYRYHGRSERVEDGRAVLVLTALGYYRVEAFVKDWQTRRDAGQVYVCSLAAFAGAFRAAELPPPEPDPLPPDAAEGDPLPEGPAG